VFKFFSERTTDALAVAGATSPLWLNETMLTNVLTALGIAWLMLQIYLKLEERYFKND
jgi:hypothetical protein